MPSSQSWRERAIAAVAKERNATNDCGCDGCLADVVLSVVVAALRERPLGEPAHVPPIRADEWAANYIEREFIDV